MYLSVINGANETSRFCSVVDKLRKMHILKKLESKCELGFDRSRLQYRQTVRYNGRLSIMLVFNNN